MKRRVGRHGDSAPPGVESAQRKKVQQQQRTATSRWWLKRGLLALIVAFIFVPFSLRVLPEFIQHFAHTYRVRLPFFVDLSQPAELSLNHTINMYLTSEEGISLGVWHTVPESQWKEAQGKDLAWYQSTLSNGRPVFIYLHGNTGNRAAPHRIGVAKLLSALGHHVLVPDYRGFGDSTGEPTEEGLNTDAIYVFNWVKSRCGNCQVIFWGHSLGSGVSTNIAVKLIQQGVVLDGVILEGAFDAAPQHETEHPFSWYYWKFPGTGYLFPFPWANNKLTFTSGENLKKIRSPILFLHSEDDPVVPIQIPRKMYEIAVSTQNKERVRMVSFDGAMGYLHNGLYRDLQTPGIIKDFVQSIEH